MPRSSIVVACLVSACALTPLLAGPASRAAIGPRAASLNGVTFSTGTNGCTGPLVGIYGSSAAKAFILQAARDYCATFATPSSAPDVEYADGGDSCPGDLYAQQDSTDPIVGVSTVFADSCANDAQPPVDSTQINDTLLAVNIVDEIATCPGAQQPNGGALNPAGPTQCGPFSTDPGASGSSSCSPAAISLAQAQVLYNQQIGTERAIGGCSHANAVQNRVAGAGDRITFCFNVFGAGIDLCKNEGSAQPLAPTTGTEINDVCVDSSRGAPPADGNYAQGYVARAALVSDPNSTARPPTTLQGCGVVNVGGASGYNGSCDPGTSVSQCPGDADVASGRYQIWGYLHLVTNANTANNAAARDFVDFVQNIEGANLVQAGFVPTCEMQFARSVDAGPYVATSAGCPTATACVSTLAGMTPPAHSFDGSISADHNVIGVEATISTHMPALCTGSASVQSATSTWAMIYPRDDKYPYAQSGYILFAGQPLKFFTEYKQNDTSHFVRNVNINDIGPINQASTHKYDEFYDFTAGRMDMAIDNVVEARTTFDPIVEPAWTGQDGWGAQWFAEPNNPGDDVPGTVQNPTIFSGLGVQTSRGGGLYAPTGIRVGQSGPAAARFSGAPTNTVNTSQFSTWTR